VKWQGEERHGEDRRGRVTAEYTAWISMKARCYNPHNSRYHVYGARGIAVCERWRDSYSRFLEDMGRKPSAAHSLDRVRSDGNYEPGNCRWATEVEQQNNRGNNRRLFVRGELMTFARACRVLDVPSKRVYCRLGDGWPLPAAFCAPRGLRLEAISREKIGAYQSVVWEPS